MFTFLHAADIHLDSPLRGLEAYPDAPVGQIRSASRRAFDNLVELAISEQVAFVLLAGDVFDGDWRDYNTGLYFVNRMGRLRQAGIPVFMVSGNHDAASIITRSLKLPDNVTLFGDQRAGTVLLEGIGAAVHGRSFATKAVREDLVPSYPVGDSHLFNVGLLHTSLNGRDGHEPYAPTTLDALRSRGYDYWALGHVHQREEVALEPRVLFSGTIQGRHVRETGAKGCTLVRVAEGRVRGVEHRALDVLRWAECRLDASGCEASHELLWRLHELLEAERSRSDGRPLAVRVVLQGASHLHASSPALHEELRGVAAALGDVWIEKIAMRGGEESGAAAARPDSAALAGLWGRISAIGTGGAGIAEGIPELEKLRQKLPAELLAGGDPFEPDAEALAALRSEVREMLGAWSAGGGADED